MSEYIFHTYLNLWTLMTFAFTIQKPRGNKSIYIYFYMVSDFYLNLLFLIFNRTGVGGAVLQLDGVGPIENRPSTNKLHHFVQKKGG